MLFQIIPSLIFCNKNGKIWGHVWMENEFFKMFFFLIFFHNHAKTIHSRILGCDENELKCDTNAHSLSINTTL